MFKAIGSIATLLVFVGFWSAITLAFDVMLVGGIVLQLRAESYPTTIGKVLRSKVKFHHDSDGSTTGVDVRYDYTIGNHRYTCDRWRYAAMSASDDWANRFVKDHPTGSRVTVHYNAADPADATLMTGVQGSDLFFLLFMTPFNMIMLGGWAAGVAMLRRRRADPTSPGVPIVDDGQEIRVCLREFSPLAASLAAVGIAAFVAIFPLAFTVGFHPSLELMGLVWGAVGGVAAAAGVVVWWRSDLPSNVLTIARLRDEIVLPTRFGRSEPVAIRLDELTAIDVEPIVTKSDDSARTNYELFVRWQTRAGQQESAKLLKWSDGDRVQRLAAWLRVQCRLAGEAQAVQV